MGMGLMDVIPHDTLLKSQLKHMITAQMNARREAQKRSSVKVMSGIVLCIVNGNSLSKVFRVERDRDLH